MNESRDISSTKFLPDSITVANSEATRNYIKEKILLFYGQWVESERPDHIITRIEAQQILGLKTDGALTVLLRQAYGADNFTNVLEALGLPFKKTKRDF